MRPSPIVGVASVVFGLAVVVRRSFAGAIPLDYWFVLVLGAIAFILGLVYVQRWHRADRVFTETGDPERRYLAPTPGDDADRALAGSGFGPHGIGARHDVRERVRRTALDTLVARKNVSREEAVRRVNRGTWTGDPLAAWFLGADRSLPLRLRLRSFIGRESLFRVGATRTVDELARLQESAGTSTPSGSAGGRRELEGADGTAPEVEP